MKNAAARDDLANTKTESIVTVFHDLPGVKAPSGDKFRGFEFGVDGVVLPGAGRAAQHSKADLAAGLARG